MWATSSGRQVSDTGFFGRRQSVPDPNAETVFIDLASVPIRESDDRPRIRVSMPSEPSEISGLRKWLASGICMAVDMSSYAGDMSEAEAEIRMTAETSDCACHVLGGNVWLIVPCGFSLEIPKRR